jgi:hypothetical protein
LGGIATTPEPGNYFYCAIGVGTIRAWWMLTVSVKSSMAAVAESK